LSAGWIFSGGDILFAGFYVDGTVEKFILSQVGE
jgi:hypothetical protein